MVVIGTNVITMTSAVLPFGITEEIEKQPIKIQQLLTACFGSESKWLCLALIIRWRWSPSPRPEIVSIGARRGGSESAHYSRHVRTVAVQPLIIIIAITTQPFATVPGVYSL